MRISTWIAVVGMCIGTPAFAGSADDYDASSPFSWAGAYVGAQAGYSWGEVHSHDVSKSGGNSDWRGSSGPDGAIGGVHAGYNYVFNSIILGFEGDIEAANFSGKIDSEFAGIIETNINVQGSLRARIGYSMGRALIYGTGGLAIGDIQSTYDEGSTHDNSTNIQAGWTAGGGVEYAWSPHWTTRVEYRYTDFGRFTDNPKTDSGWNYPTDVIEQGVRAGVSYKF
ncbi:outer membrane protein [Hyphomicrobium sp.]|jgi:outer membrane immunogenic protein|uniref:outer membrane protein n=1 Tax=Hyphomicrobium sp. TaxID=82 RepID=UPI0035673ED2